jgi:hypothetical protein
MAAFLTGLVRGCPAGTGVKKGCVPSRRPKQLCFASVAGFLFNGPRMSQTHPLTTTAFELPGCRVVQSFGVVRGIVVRSRSVIGDIGAGLRSFLILWQDIANGPK